jgi:hypothetical protein
MNKRTKCGIAADMQAGNDPPLATRLHYSLSFVKSHNALPDIGCHTAYPMSAHDDAKPGGKKISVRPGGIARLSVCVTA